jgi:hypothetical protein
MKIVLAIIAIILFGQFTLAQGYGIGIEFYPDPIPEGKLFNQDFWEKKVKKLARKSRKSPNDARLLYKLAIAKGYVITNDMTDIIMLLDSAIEVDSTQAKFYAVRGIVKYDWGAYSPDFDIAEGCPDIRKALEMGLKENLKSNEAINGILNHPSCH